MGNRPISSGRYSTAQPDTKRFHLHTHGDYEIFLFISGKAKYYIEGTVYHLKPYDMLIIKKAEAHTLLLLKNVEYERVVINFKESALMGDSHKIIEFLDSKPLGLNNKYPASVLKDNDWMKYIDIICKDEDMETKRLYLTVLLNEMYKKRSFTQNGDETKETVAKIVEYINNNLRERLSLDDICNRFYISKTHINYKFKKVIGTTVYAYIKQKRVLLAKSLLASGEKPSAVCEKCGFLDYNSFYKAYVSYFGRSPNRDYENLKD